MTKTELTGAIQSSSTCPVVGDFLFVWNLGVEDDATRARFLVPLVPKLHGTRSADGAVVLRRMWMAIDWDVRVHAVAWLRLAGLAAHADNVARRPEIVSVKTLGASQRVCREAMFEMYAAMAAWAATWPAACAAEDAKGEAAWAAARGAARDKALAAANKAEENKVWDAASAAAGSSAWAEGGDTREAAWTAARFAGTAAGSGTAKAAADSGTRGLILAALEDEAMAEAAKVAKAAVDEAAWKFVQIAGSCGADLAALDVARHVALREARPVVFAAVKAAVSAKLGPTVSVLQSSAADLVLRMCAVGMPA